MRLVDNLSAEAVEDLVAGKNKFKLLAESEDGTQRRTWLLQVRCDTQETLAGAGGSGGSLSGSLLRHRRSASGTAHASPHRSEAGGEGEAGPAVASFKISMVLPFLAAALLLWLLEPLAPGTGEEEPSFLSEKMRFWAAFLVGVVSSWLSLRALR